MEQPDPNGPDGPDIEKELRERMVKPGFVTSLRSCPCHNSIRKIPLVLPARNQKLQAACRLGKCREYPWSCFSIKFLETASRSHRADMNFDVWACTAGEISVNG
jgi:hypothetical protein